MTWLEVTAWFRMARRVLTVQIQSNLITKHASKSFGPLRTAQPGKRDEVGVILPEFTVPSCQIRVLRPANVLSRVAAARHLKQKAFALLKDRVFVQ